MKVIQVFNINIEYLNNKNAIFPKSNNFLYEDLI